MFYNALQLVEQSSDDGKGLGSVPDPAVYMLKRVIPDAVPAAYRYEVNG